MGFAWLYLSFFDSQLTRDIFLNLIYISVLGPFAVQWYNIIEYAMEGDNNDLLTKPYFYFWMATYAVITFFEQLIQLQLLP